MAHAVARWAKGPGHDVLLDRVVVPRRSARAADIAIVAAGALLIILATQVRIPLGFTPVPLTGQTFAVLLIGAAAGPARGVAAVLLYLGLGAAGLPVFSQGGAGTGYLLGATGGYLFGFAAAAAVAGWLARFRADRRLVPAVLAMAAASVVIYAFGIGGLMVATGASLLGAIELGLLPFLVTDAIKVVAAGALLPAAWRLVGELGGGAR